MIDSNASAFARSWESHEKSVDNRAFRQGERQCESEL
jgi:hypothetical protein